MERVAGITPQTFLEGIEMQLGPESARLTAKTYGVTPDMDQNLFMNSALRWVGDVLFDGIRLLSSP